MSHALGTRGAIPERKGQSVTRFTRWNRDKRPAIAASGIFRAASNGSRPPFRRNCRGNWASPFISIAPRRDSQRLTSVYGIERAPIKADRTAIVEASKCTSLCVCPGYRSRDRSPAARFLSLTPAAENVTDVRGMRLRSDNSGEAAPTGAINKANGPLVGHGGAVEMSAPSASRRRLNSAILARYNNRQGDASQQVVMSLRIFPFVTIYGSNHSHNFRGPLKWGFS